jgi:hypothetical protein
LKNLSTWRETPIGRLLGRLLATELMALFPANGARAIDPNRTMSQDGLERWGPEQGFSRGSVYSIGQSADGCLVVAALKGLLRFDGLTFQQIHSVDLEPLLNRVVGLVTDAQGILWLRLSASGIPASLRPLQVLAMLVDRGSNVWLGTNSHGPLRRPPAEFLPWSCWISQHRMP